MNPFQTVVACIVSVSTLHATTEDEVCATLADALRQETEILASVRDFATAQAALVPLKNVLDKLTALNGQIDDNELWNYIDSREELKQELLACAREFAKVLTHLERSRFYGSKSLYIALRPQLNPEWGTADEE